MLFSMKKKLGGSNFAVKMLFFKQIPYSYETFELGKIVIYIFMMRESVLIQCV